jgi:hypothetical protein
MNVIGHEHVGMDVAGGLGRVLVQQRQIDQVVSSARKTGAAIVPTLDDVKRHRGQDQAFMS